MKRGCAMKTFSPKEIAEMLGVSVDKVVGHWIASGELSAINVATEAGMRPRFRVPAAALDEFVASRTTVQTPQPTPQRRRKKNPQSKQYF